MIKRVPVPNGGLSQTNGIGQDKKEFPHNIQNWNKIPCVHRRTLFTASHTHTEYFQNCFEKIGTSSFKIAPSCS